MYYSVMYYIIQYKNTSQWWLRRTLPKLSFIFMCSYDMATYIIA